jgi:MATE family multidrug resistance protein
LKQAGIPRIVWGIALPLLFAELSEIVVQVTDTIFLARVGVAELGAIALADSIWEMFLVLPLGLVDGIQILTGRLMGRRQGRAAGEIFNQGLLLIVVTVVVLAALLAALLPWLAPLVSDDPEVVVATERFLGVALFGLPFTAAAFGYSALLSSLGKTRVLVPATILLAATNALLGWVLIFGRFGAPPMGIRGAAIASVAAEIVTFLFLTVYLVRLPATRRLGLFRFRGWNRRVVRRLFRLSGPVSLQGFVQAIRWFLFFVLVATLGPVALAVASVVYACYVTPRIPTEAFAEAACSLTSRLIGRDRPGRVGIVIRSATTGASIITAPAVVLALIAPEWVLSVFSLEPSLLGAGVASLRVVALAMLIVTPAEMWFAAVLGTGDSPASLGLEVLLTVLTLSGAAIGVFVMSGGVELAWGALALGWLAVLVASWAWMRSGRWRQRAV